jgi:hypothetical protein
MGADAVEHVTKIRKGVNLAQPATGDETVQVYVRAGGLGIDYWA